ncbi:OpgC domain-containing protein [Reinekea marina]|uniref:OpgC domain-containing protein n=1 Tax=Reinekea marina TaxID=1310421 RepID=UPI0025B5A954|nr:OpgC domain-containing protein [Reinekea marina]MDN3648042.1 OpgC domain-containing protein [Reinekea marina]
MDLIRGCLLTLMTINHLNGWWVKYTWQPFGYFSAAEGFVMLSAVTAGWIYSRSFNGLNGSLKPLNRALTLYKYQIVTIGIISGLFLTFPIYGESWVRWLRPLQLDAQRTLFMEALLIQQPKHLDIIPMYAGFMLLLPLLLWISKLKLYWIAICASLLLWYFDPYIAVRRFSIFNLCGDCQYSYFNWFRWQVLWVLGVGLGIAITKRASFLKVLQRPLITIALLGVFVLLYSIKSQWLELPIVTKANVSRENLGWLRLVSLLNFSLLIYSIFYLVRRSVKLPLLNVMGRNSLQVFSVQVLLIYLLKPLNEFLMGNKYSIASTALALLVVLMLAAVAWLYESRLKNIKRTRVAAVP